MFAFNLYCFIYPKFPLALTHVGISGLPTVFPINTTLKEFLFHVQNCEESHLCLQTVSPVSCELLGPLSDRETTKNRFVSIVFPLQTWSEHVNIQKALLPGLWSLLAAGGYGSAKVAYPCLLPFLRELIKQVHPS